MEKTSFFEEEIDHELVSLLIDGINFTEARKNFEAVADEIEFKVIFSLVQKLDVQHIKQAWLNSRKEQNQSN